MGKNLILGRSQAEVQFFRTLTTVLDPTVHIAVSKYFKWLINPKTGRQLELDFYLGEYKVAFEIQGPHHFTNPEQIYRDEVKKFLCEKNGVRLIRLGILENNPYKLFRKLRKLKNEGVEIKLRKPSYHWEMRVSRGKNYNEKIKKEFGNREPCYRNPDSFFAPLPDNSKRAWIVKPNGKKEYI